MTGKVALVGAGPGDPGLMTIRGRELLSQCDVVIYDALISDCILNVTPKSARRIYVGKRAGQQAKPQEEINELMIQEAMAGRFVIRLKGGDPFLFGRGGEEALYLAEHGIAFEVVPGVTALTAVTAYAGIPVTERDLSSCLIVVTGHEDPAKGESAVDWSRIAQTPGTIVLFMGIHNLSGIVRTLMASGREASTPTAVIQYGTLPEQRTVVGTLGDITARVEEAGVEAPALVIIGGVVRLRDRLNWFESRPLFGKTIVNTRPSDQSAELCKALSDLGALVICLPMIRIVPPEDPEPLRNAVRGLDRYDWILFTSSNAVDAFFEALFKEGADARRLAGCRIATVGTKTEESLRERGIIADHTPEQFCSDALFQSLHERESLAGRRVLCPCSSIAPSHLENRLRAAGAVVDRVDAYAVVPENPEMPAWERMPDAFLFASPSAVTHFADWAGKDRLDKFMGHSIFVSIGPATSKRMNALGIPVQIQAEDHNAEGLVKALVRYFGNSL
ncbi:MAG TPA: uroporphyrinogen-III C-methyltransferase [bacterium]|nr:uroporphyrinogen-III C-methyltransferase [bacterium]HQL60860.1 uroporphyrinogen-III C-methyltransferase [bacterium]